MGLPILASFGDNVTGLALSVMALIKMVNTNNRAQSLPPIFLRCGIAQGTGLYDYFTKSYGRRNDWVNSGFLKLQLLISVMEWTSSARYYYLLFFSIDSIVFFFFFVLCVKTWSQRREHVFYCFLFSITIFTTASARYNLIFLFSLLYIITIVIIILLLLFNNIFLILLFYCMILLCLCYN